jgi:hypothetical protein
LTKAQISQFLLLLKRQGRQFYKDYIKDNFCFEKQDEKVEVIIKALEMDYFYSSGAMVPPQMVKVKVVGDAGTGKTSLLYSFSNNSSELPRFDNKLYHTVNCTFADKPLVCQAHETKPDAIFNLNLETDVVVICFSISNIKSFENACTKWPEVIKSEFGPCPMILHANMTDLRDPVLTKNDQVTL